MNRFTRQITAFNLIVISLLILSMAAGCSQGTPTSTATEAATQPPEAEQPNPTPAVVSIAQISTLLFQDDFQDGDTAGWEINTGWSVHQEDDRVFFGTVMVGGAYVKDGAGWADYSYRSSFRVNHGVLLISINVSSSGRYILRLGGQGVYLIREQPAETFSVLAEAGPMSLETSHGVAFANLQGHLQVYIDKVLWFDVVDDAPILAGTIAVGAMENTNAGVDNILVTRITGDLPAGTPEAPASLSSVPLNVEELQQVADVLPAADVETVVVDLPADQPPVADGSPDLVMSAILTVPDPILKGLEFEVVFSVANNGTAASGAFDVLVHFHALAKIDDCRMPVAGLAPGEIAQGSCFRTITGNTGNYPVELTADIDEAVVESNEDNNLVVDTITVAAPTVPTETPVPVVGLPDLVVISITAEKFEDGIFWYRCTYANNGTAGSLTSINLRIFLNSGQLLQEGNSIPLNAGETDYWVFLVGTTLPPGLTCTVDANSTVIESDETNNSVTIIFD